MLPDLSEAFQAVSFERVYTENGQIILESRTLPCSLDQCRKPGNGLQMTQPGSMSVRFLDVQLRTNGEKQICP